MKRSREWEKPEQEDGSLRPSPSMDQKINENVIQYRYQALQPNEIRLIQRDPGRGHEPLQCSIIPYHFEAQWVAYTALSYCWGEPTLSAVLYCPEALPITASLHSALRRLRHDTLTLLVWADAVCINQGDIDERNEQVLLMRDIYQKAGRVAIHLGDESENSGLVPSLVLAWRERDRRESEAQVAKRAEVGMNALAALLRRSWFKRIWVIQEAALAKIAVVLCGCWTMSFGDLVDVAKILTAGDYYCTENSLLMQETTLGVQQVRLMGKLGDMVRKEEKIDILWLFEQAPNSQATNPADLLYAMLGLTDPDTAASLKPDYSEPIEDTLSRYAAFFVSCGAQKRLLSRAHCRSWRSGVPTWIPDWAAFREIEASISERGLDLAHIHDEMCIEKSEPPTPTCSISDDSRVLTLRGIGLGKIHILGADNRKLIPDHTKSRKTLKKAASALILVMKTFLDAQTSTLTPTDRPLQRWSLLLLTAVQVDGYTLRWFPGINVSAKTSLNDLPDVVLDHIVLVACFLQVCISTSGIFCQVPYGSEVGDELVLLNSVDTPFENCYPFVLRRCGDAYKVVGMCYMDGLGAIMRAFVGTGQKGLWKEFSLV